MSYKDEVISAFAFKTGKLIEELINERTLNLNETNIQLQAKILGFRNEINKEFIISSRDLITLYDKWFNIEEFKNGKI